MSQTSLAAAHAATMERLSNIPNARILIDTDSVTRKCTDGSYLVPVSGFVRVTHEQALTFTVPTFQGA